MVTPWTSHISQRLSALAGSVVGDNGVRDVDEPTFAGASEPAHGRLATAPDLVRDFIAAASKTCADAAVSSEPKIKELVALWAMLSRMPVFCSPATVACADRFMRQRSFLVEQCIH